MEEAQLRLFEVGEPNYAIECSVNEQVLSQRKELTIDPNQEYQSENSIDAVVSALRLFRSWFTGYSNIFPFKDLDVFVPLQHKPKHIVSDRQLDRSYALDNNDILEFQRFWKDFGCVLKDIRGIATNGKTLVMPWVILILPTIEPTRDKLMC